MDKDLQRGLSLASFILIETLSKRAVLERPWGLLTKWNFCEDGRMRFVIRLTEIRECQLLTLQPIIHFIPVLKCDLLEFRLNRTETLKSNFLSFKSLQQKEGSDIGVFKVQKSRFHPCFMVLVLDCSSCVLMRFSRHRGPSGRGSTRLWHMCSAYLKRSWQDNKVDITWCRKENGGFWSSVQYVSPQIHQSSAFWGYWFLILLRI